jgi:hypothetical protein
MSELSKQRKLAATILTRIEDYLEEKGVKVPNKERDQNGDESAAILYGTDYYILEDEITELVKDYDVS